MDLVCNNIKKKKKKKCKMTGVKSVLAQHEYSDEQQNNDSCVPAE